MSWKCDLSTDSLVFDVYLTRNINLKFASFGFCFSLTPDNLKKGPKYAVFRPTCLFCTARVFGRYHRLFPNFGVQLNTHAEFRKCKKKCDPSF